MLVSRTDDPHLEQMSSIAKLLSISDMLPVSVERWYDESKVLK
jgi:hypothetical protein